MSDDFNNGFNTESNRDPRDRSRRREERRDERRSERLERRLKMKYAMHKQWPNGAVSVHLIIGLVVVVLGLLFLVSNLHIIELRSPMRYFWSAVFLSIGFALLLEHRSERTWQWGIGWILVGIWQFAYQSGWIDVNLSKVFWPLVFLGVGGYLVRRALTEDRIDQTPIVGPNGEPVPPPPGGIARTIRGVGVLSGSELKPTTNVDRAELFALMGGVKLDLYDAQLVNDSATINVAACMGGIEIHVPSEWSVVSNVLPLMGAFIDKRRPAAAGTAPKKTLIINGFVLMGGVEVKN